MNVIAYLKCFSIYWYFSFRTISTHYSSLVFENFELTRTLYIKELDIVSLAFDSRSALQKRFRAVHTLKNNDHTSKYGSFVHIRKQIRHQFWLDLTNALNDNLSFVNGSVLFELNISKRCKTKALIHCDFDTEKKYGYFSHNTIITAATELVRLQETYVQNISLYSKGYLGIKNDNGHGNRMIDTLKVDDLVLMSCVAINQMNWYDTALKYLKVAVKQLSTPLEKMSFSLHHRLEETIDKMTRCYPSIHNDLVAKKMNSIGPGWKLFPFNVGQGNIPSNFYFLFHI